MLEPLIPDPAVRVEKRGAAVSDRRALLDGIVWILRTGSPWADIPYTYPPKSTVQRWNQRWVVEGVFDRIMARLAADLYALDALDLADCFIDGTFAPTKQGGASAGKTKRGKGTRIMGIMEAHGLPVSALIASAIPHGVTLAPCRAFYLWGRASRYEQPGVSQQIARHETGIGMTLINRQPRRLQLTPPGEALLPYAEQLLALADEAVEAAWLAVSLSDRNLNRSRPDPL
jgi:transposase